MRARLIVIWLCFSMSAVALAQSASNDDLARARFFEGRAAYDARDYERALKAWEESYAISRRPELLYNLGLAAQRLGRREQALESFEAYLAWGKGERADEVRGRVETLRDLAGNDAYPPEPEPVAATTAPPTAPAPVTVARAAEPAKRPSPTPAPRVEPKRGSGRGWWIATVVVLAAAGIAVSIAVPLSQRHDKPADVPNTGLTINALRWAP